MIQHALCYMTLDTTTNLWHDTPNIKPIALSMNKATARPLLEDPHRCAYQERLGGCQANYPRLWFSCYYIVFFQFLLFCATRYLPLQRPISREDAHWMYPRYIRVFLYVMIYWPLTHQSLWERLGVSLSCTCVAFSPFAKLNRFFSKKEAGNQG